MQNMGAGEPHDAVPVTVSVQTFSWYPGVISKKAKLQRMKSEAKHSLSCLDMIGLSNPVIIRPTRLNNQVTERKT